ncbi:response regulator [uncultured Cyclobacterium sp.]|uniref:response regulator n=1 Tax=uncultured Cyclobacterium sp. TaxID=453820 RepID=UPI0030EDCC62|tara:strand:+ start:103882 stop:104298 length:417 start_codon:yes stop_codon:yes gene_type:complete
MTLKLNSILLVDDDKATNFVNNFTIKRSACSDNVVIAENGLEALEYLRSKQGESSTQPNVIFLDINMPIMNGWEFLEEYEKLKHDNREDIIFIMLTTSLNPDDVNRAKSFTSISGYRNKPLTAKMIEDIVEEYVVVNY